MSPVTVVSAQCGNHPSPVAPAALDGEPRSSAGRSTGPHPRTRRSVAPPSDPRKRRGQGVSQVAEDDSMVASIIGVVCQTRDVGRRAFDGAWTIGSTAIPRTLPRSGGVVRSARCRHQVRSRPAPCGFRHLRRAAPASTGFIATARVTAGTATRLRTRATLPSGPTRAASRHGAARVAHRVRRPRTSSAASFSAGACQWEADRKLRDSLVSAQCSGIGCPPERP